MARIRIATRVRGNYYELLSRFDRRLFEALKPPFGRVEIVRFDGSTPGDVVHVRLFLPLAPPQEWVSVITDSGANATAAWFTDEGRQLPFFLSYWRHIHRVENAGDHSNIVDDIEFKGRLFPSWLLWPVLWAQFAARRPVYRRFFAQ